MVSNRRGFTLIELLVVIACIGIMASIVIGGISGSRTTTKDARIKAEMTQVRIMAQALRNDDFSYMSAFVTPLANVNCGIQGAADPDLLKIAQDIKSLNGVTNCISTQPNNGELRIYVSGTAFGATAKLASGTFWCVDSTGADKGGYATRDAALTDSTDYTCN